LHVEVRQRPWVRTINHDMFVASDHNPGYPTNSTFETRGVQPAIGRNHSRARTGVSTRTWLKILRSALSASRARA
jgi:hypothetical protein